MKILNQVYSYYKRVSLQPGREDRHIKINGSAPLWLAMALQRVPNIARYHENKMGQNFWQIQDLHLEDVIIIA